MIWASVNLAYQSLNSHALHIWTWTTLKYSIKAKFWSVSRQSWPALLLQLWYSFEVFSWTWSVLADLESWLCAGQAPVSPRGTLRNSASAEHKKGWKSIRIRNLDIICELLVWGTLASPMYISCSANRRPVEMEHRWVSCSGHDPYHSWRSVSYLYTSWHHVQRAE